MVKSHGGVSNSVIDGGDAVSKWRRIGDFGWTEETAPVAGIRATVLPSDTPCIIQSMQDMEDSSDLTWRATTQTAQGVIDVHWHKADESSSTDQVGAAISRTMQEVRSIGGTAVVTHAPPAIKESLDMWGETTYTIDTMRNLKRQYDPHRLLNPGRFMGGI